VTIELRVHPRARRTALEWAGQGPLKASVTAPAEAGRANKALIDLLAAEWRLARSSFEVTKGAGGRDKVLSISGDTTELAGRIASWAGLRGGEHD
jgi:uncharacterized protein YggU (UPF0235/DUF167 family)